MLDIISAVSNAASITPKSMETGRLVQTVNFDRPQNGLGDLQELEAMPEEISEDLLLDEVDRLGEMTRARELVQEIVKIRKDQRKEQVNIYKEGLRDKKDAIDSAAKVTAANGEFARYLQGHLLSDRKEERFTTGYQRLRNEAVSMF